MKLSTPVPIQSIDSKINYTSEILNLGSCFAENIGERLDYFKFKQVQNPFGILFQPKAILKVLEMANCKRKINNSEIFQHQDLWHHFDAHSRLSHPDAEVLLKNLNSAVEALSETLKNSTHIFITFGTAWIYRYLASGEIVANCHKISQSKFSKELLTSTEIQRIILEILDLIWKQNSKAKITFTISPVRHIKDGIVENNHSKAHLLTALHEVLEMHPNKLDYFPSYEILLDELRDYRFFKRDLVHPSDLAIDFIWEKFKVNYIENSA
ncbi:MAG: GSCFA domain-containing protein, partial [Psychroflexus sp.]